MRRSKRPTLRAFLRWVWVPVVAFVVVVAVAMACAVWSPIYRWGVSFDSFDNRYFSIPGIMRKYGDDGLGGIETKGWGTSYYIINYRAVVTEGDKQEIDGVTMHLGRYGFPFRCMRWRCSPYHEMGDFSPFIIGIETSRPSAMYNRGRRIPLMPEPVGMVLNVLIYSAAIVLCRLAWRRAVVVRRRTKGLCVKCAYPTGDFAVCPECGGSIESS